MGSSFAALEMLSQYVIFPEIGITTRKPGSVVTDVIVHIGRGWRLLFGGCGSLIVRGLEPSDGDADWL